MPKQELGNCEYCGKKLVPIANKRSNGTHRHNDWSTRKYHKKCWKEMNYDTDFN